MPIVYHNKPYIGNCRSFAAIDEIVLNQVVPSLQWETRGKMTSIDILPNAFFGRHHETNRIIGPTLEQDPKLYFVVACVTNAGLSYAETGLWLDTSLDMFQRRWTDEKKIWIKAGMESVARFELRKPRYVYKKIPRKKLYYFYE